MSTSSQPYHVAIPSAAMALPPQDPAVPAEVYEEVARLGLGEHFPRVVQLTHDLFDADFVVNVEQDPEIAHWFQVVFTVHMRGTIDEILEKNTLWHRRLPHNTTEAQGAFCLSIDQHG